MNIAKIVDLIPQRLEARIEAGDTKRRRPHIHSAPVLSEIERRSDNRYTGMGHNNGNRSLAVAAQ
jgi:hypothetical protein